MVFVAALIAPAILASGMLMADFTGYGERSDLAQAQTVRGKPAGTAGEGRTPGAAGGDRAPTGTPGARPSIAPPSAPVVNGQENERLAVDPKVRETLLDPTPVPEPPGPARLYKRLVRIVPVSQPVRRVVSGVALKVTRPVDEKPEPREETPFRCAPEWRDTWLWELCREREAQD